jgi:hypothetical protein
MKTLLILFALILLQNVFAQDKKFHQVYAYDPRDIEIEVLSKHRVGVGLYPSQNKLLIKENGVEVLDACEGNTKHTLSEAKEDIERVIEKAEKKRVMVGFFFSVQSTCRSAYLTNIAL